MPHSKRLKVTRHKLPHKMGRKWDAFFRELERGRISDRNPAMCLFCVENDDRETPPVFSRARSLFAHIRLEHNRDPSFGQVRQAFLASYRKDLLGRAVKRLGERLQNMHNDLSAVDIGCPFCLVETAAFGRAVEEPFANIAVLVAHILGTHSSDPTWREDVRIIREAVEQQIFVDPVASDGKYLFCAECWVELERINPYTNLKALRTHIRKTHGP